MDPRIRDAIEAHAAHYPTRRAACLDALRIVQSHRGWVSDEDLREVANLLHISVDELEGVATFYNLVFRKPVGDQVILVCDSVSCWLTGGDALRKAICERLGVELGQTTADGRYTVLPMCCLGACDRAPVLMIDDELHGPVGPEGLSALLGSR